jgi:aerotaxis receptor
MRNNQPVTQRERTFPAQQRLISTTDAKGVITYCNDAFVEISGFSRDELMRAPHNLVRHPDVPAAVFAHMWTTLKQGLPWMGIVKNRCKTGDHYWVNAYVTPVFDGEQVIGYESVRVKPTAEQIRRAEALYQRINQGKSAIPRSDKWLPVLQDWLPFILVSQLSFLIGVWFDSHWGFALAAALSVPLGLLGLSWQQRGLKRLLRPLRQLSERARQIADNPVSQAIYTGRADELGQIEFAMQMLEAQVGAVVGRIGDASQRLSGHAAALVEQLDSSHSSTLGQQSQTDQVATAIHEMAASVAQVANHAQQASKAADQAGSATREGHQRVDESRDAVLRLSQELARATTVIHQLESHSGDISGVLEVIRAIAEQTNLLALNAAIEAARAGEQAVVCGGGRRSAAAGATHQRIHRADPCPDRQAATDRQHRRADHGCRASPG